MKSVTVSKKRSRCEVYAHLAYNFVLFIITRSMQSAILLQNKTFHKKMPACLLPGLSFATMSPYLDNFHNNFHSMCSETDRTLKWALIFKFPISVSPLREMAEKHLTMRRLSILPIFKLLNLHYFPSLGRAIRQYKKF